MKQPLKEKSWLLREKYGGIETPEFFEDLKRLEKGELIDHLIGFCDFLGCRIDLSFRPLIPREETQWWVEKAIREMQGTSGDKNISALDIFAGSGCIGVALLKHVPRTSVDFGEKKPTFAAQIKKNVVLNSIDPRRIRIFTSDIFQKIPSKKYDYIFANPPYISRDKMKRVQRSVLEHEPLGALFAPGDGLLYIKKLIEEAPRFLAPDGKLLMEFDSWQKPEIKRLAVDSPFRSDFWKDQFGRWRTVVLKMI